MRKFNSRRSRWGRCAASVRARARLHHRRRNDSPCAPHFAERSGEGQAARDGRKLQAATCAPARRHRTPPRLINGGKTVCRCACKSSSLAALASTKSGPLSAAPQCTPLQRDDAPHCAPAKHSSPLARAAGTAPLVVANARRGCGCGCGCGGALRLDRHRSGRPLRRAGILHSALDAASKSAAARAGDAQAGKRQFWRGNCEAPMGTRGGGSGCSADRAEHLQSGTQGLLAGAMLRHGPGRVRAAPSLPPQALGGLRQRRRATRRVQRAFAGPASGHAL